MRVCIQMTWRFPLQQIHPTSQIRKKKVLCLVAQLKKIYRPKTLFWSCGPEGKEWYLISTTIILSVMDDLHKPLCTVVSWTQMKWNIVFHNQGERIRLTALQSLLNEPKWWLLICPSRYIHKTGSSGSVCSCLPEHLFFPTFTSAKSWDLVCLRA